MSKAKRRILKAKIDYISLCPRGMNGFQTIYKSDDDTSQELSFQSFSKQEMTKDHVLWNCVWAPEQVCKEGDVAAASVIKDFAYDFMQRGGSIDIRHNNKTVPASAAYIAESFIIPENHPVFKDMKDDEGNPVNVTGGWGTALKILDPKLRDLYESGEWGGTSMGGLMATESVGKDDTSKVMSMFKQMLERIPGVGDLSTEDEPDMENTPMKKEELQEVTKSVLDALDARDAVKAKKAEETAEADAKKQADTDARKGLGLPKPVLKDATDEKSLDIYEKEMEIYKLSQNVDKEDVSAIRSFHAVAKSIASGEGAPGAGYGVFFKSNQDGDETATRVNSESSMGDELLKELKKEEADKAKA